MTYSLIAGAALLAFGVGAVGPSRTWQGQREGPGWRLPEGNVRIVRSSQVPDGTDFIVTADQPHHTRAVLAGSEKTPDFVLSLRAKVESWEGAPPNLYLYGRIGAEGFRGLRVGPRDATVFAWFSQEHSESLPTIQGGFGSGIASGWVHMRLACRGDWLAAKVWPGSEPEPGWQVMGQIQGQARGTIGFGVWTSPRIPSRARVRFTAVEVQPITDAGALAALGLDLGPRPGLQPGQVRTQAGVFELTDRLGIATALSALAVDRRTGEISNLIDRRTGREFVAREEKSPLFRLSLTRPDQGERRTLTSRDFRRVQVDRVQDNLLTLRFSDGPVAGLSVQATAQGAADGSIRLRARVKNPTEWCVAALTYPLIPAPAALSGDGSGDALLLPWGGGAVLPGPGRTTMRRATVYPGGAFAQFYALYGPDVGLYAALYDVQGNCKRFLLRTRRGRSVSFDFEHLFPELPRRDAVLPYDVVLRTFRGDWRDAADIYKRWATGQFWCARRLDERDDVPGFLKDGAGIIIAGIQNPAGRERLFGRNMEKLPDLLDAYRGYTGLKHLVFVPYGWENRGTWAGINYLPSVPSDAAWKAVNVELTRRGHRTAFLTSGFWWVVKRRKTSNGPAFDDSSQLEQDGKLCIQNADGTLYHVDSYDKTRTFGSWRGYSVKLCHGSSGARSLLEKTFLDVARLGVPLVSFDQEIGGGQTAPCYSRIHGHPPGWGKWMWEGFRDLCADILKKGKPIQPELGLFLENVSELAIPWMATYWSRQFGEIDVGVGGGRGVGLFSYLYHEYVTAIGAACVQGQGFMHGGRPGAELRVRVLANNLVRGLIPGPFMHDVPLRGGDPWRRTVSRAYAAFCRPYAHFPEYLLLGRTLRPPQVECARIETWFWRRSARKGKPRRKGGPPVVKVPLSLPAVIAGAFEARDGSAGTFLVNAASTPQKASVTLGTPLGGRLYGAERALVRQVPAGRPGRTLELEFKPFETLVLVTRPHGGN